MNEAVITYGLHKTVRAKSATKPQPKPQGVVGSPDISKGHVFIRPSGGMRIIDEVVALAAGATVPFWVVTRPTLGQQLGWAVGIIGLGGVVAIEAAGTEVGNFATGAAAGTAGAIALRLLHPNLSQP